MKKYFLLSVLLLLFIGCTQENKIEEPELINIIFQNNYSCDYKNELLAITTEFMEEGILVTSTLRIGQLDSQEWFCPIEKSTKNKIVSLAFINNRTITFEQTVDFPISDSCIVVINFDETLNSFIINLQSYP